MTMDVIYKECRSDSKFLPWQELNGCSVTRPFLSLRRVWLARQGADHSISHRFDQQNSMGSGIASYPGTWEWGWKVV